MEASVSTTHSLSQDKAALAGRPGWEPPTLQEIPLFAARSESVSGTESTRLSPISEPELPAPSNGKLGFSMEMAFPLAVRSAT
jgi:hypothetical protein